DQLGQAPVDARVVLSGGWGTSTEQAAGVEGWHGNLTELSLKHAGMSMRTRSPVAIAVVPGAVSPAWQWQVGSTSIEWLLPSRKGVLISHKASRGGAGRWETQGAVDQLAISRALVAELQKLFDMAAKENVDRGRVKLKSDEGNDAKTIVLAADWNLKFAGVLEGQAHIKRLSGDLIVPGEPDFPLGLQTLTVDLAAKRASDSASRLTADINLVTAKMGRAAVTAAALLRTTPGGGFAFNDNDLKTVNVDADIADLSWVSLLVGDAMEVGGSVKANVRAQSRPDGTWATSGDVSGQNIRVLRVDDGIRLLDGTLAAHLDNNRFVLDSLRFPARLRVTPKEWRTDEWVTTNPDAKGGSLTLSGDWDLFASAGSVNIDLYRYPILQRTDRYAMVTGKLKIDMPLPKIVIAGEIKADAGWFDLDMLSTVPSLDGDVVVVRPGDKQKEVNVPTEVSMDLTVDLGPRFYITGYGVNSGLVGQMQILMADSKLTAHGALRTRGGAIEAYGQRLQLRRGTITFQGDITSPVLNIEAVRTGVAVEAGVRVAGTAKRPRIDLVSYPDVSDVQKLSWLLLGRGPDESGGDAALLFSVGTSFLGSGEPFYRKFGLDEVSVRSGELGSTGSILPVESVVRGLDSGTSEIENQFVIASKKLSNGITLSIEQALSDAGTVGRASYKLSRNLSAEISAGTVNGIALIYRIFSMD
ncbi:MAG TPA: translocation/assembly module TamB domain-containing protein, partial [Eoetvoesiella sp.]